MRPYPSCEASAALLIRPSHARECEGKAGAHVKAPWFLCTFKMPLERIGGLRLWLMHLRSTDIFFLSFFFVIWFLSGAEETRRRSVSSPGV